MSKNFKCPNCNKKFSPFLIFRITKLSSSVTCKSCHHTIYPKFNPFVQKYWKYGILIGIISSVVPAQTYLLFDNNILKALLVGLASGIIVLIISIIYIYKTTYLDKH